MESGVLGRKRIAFKFEYAIFLICIIGAIFPLLFSFPYRINMFLAWDGAFRISEGQIPYRDFGTPVGYVFWLLPALFMKIFGVGVYTLIKTQVLINLLSNFLFYGMLTNLKFDRQIKLFGLTIYVVSFSLLNFWPWYNHFVFVLELGSIYLLTNALLNCEGRKKIVFMVLAGFLAAMAFLTKQDTGALGFLLGLAVLSHHYFVNRSVSEGIIYLLAWVLGLCVLILPFLQYDFMYWFNMGQFPHNSRLSIYDLFHEFLGASSWIKFYLLLIVLIVVTGNKKMWIRDQNKGLQLLIALFILFQAAIIQVTSYTPIDGNIYFHSFSVVFILANVSIKVPKSILGSALIVLCILLWWSNSYWTRYVAPKVKSLIGYTEDPETISKNSYIRSFQDSTYTRSTWALSDIEEYKNVKLPESTIGGIKKIRALYDQLGKGQNTRVLNMSELTQLSSILNYTIEKGPKIPLWFHKGVSFFDREVDQYCDNITDQKYDIILFEVIPDLNNFYPDEVMECIMGDYQPAFSFKAPRIPENAVIEVYVRPN